MSDATIQLGCWLAGLQVALVGQLRAEPERAASLRPLLGLVLGAAAAHLGWLALHPELLRAAPLRLLDLRSGFTLLAFPLGVFAAAIGLSPRDRGAWLGAALGSLPLGFAVAKLGCLAAGCCAGRPSPVLFAFGIAAHPAPIYESAGFVLVAIAAHRVALAHRAGVALAGFGIVRMGVAPLRAPDPVLAPSVEPGVLAALWVALGLGLVAAARRRAAQSITPSRRSAASSSASSESSAVSTSSVC